VPDIASGALRLEGLCCSLPGKLPPALVRIVDHEGILRIEDPEEAFALLQSAKIPSLRISHEVTPWLDARQRAQERRHALREYEQKV
jgi:hypothetical protein